MNTLRRIALGVLTLAVLLVGRPEVISAASLEATVYGPSWASGIAPGPDGNMWFTFGSAKTIGKLTPDGNLAEYPIPSATTPVYIAPGPDGNMWFVMYNKRVGRITPSGQITEYDLSSVIPTDYEELTDIAPGPDGNMWMSTSRGGSPGGNIIKVSTSGSAVVYSLDMPGVWGASSIAPGPDGNMWYTRMEPHDGTNYVSKITMNGNITSYALAEIGSGTRKIVAGPDGNMWYIHVIANGADNHIGKITMNGESTEYPLAEGSSAYYGLAAGSDDRIWYTSGNSTRSWLVAVDTNGNMTEYDLSNGVVAITVGAGHNNTLWLGGPTGLAVVQLAPDSNPPNPQQPGVASTTPKPPRTGRLAGAVLVTTATFSVIILLARAYQKKYHNPTSTK